MYTLFSFGHRSTPVQITPLTDEFMVSCGFDRKPIVWKIPNETQLIFKERYYSLDCITAIDQHHFVVGSQDG